MIKRTKILDFRIVSLDNYNTGSVNNQIENVKYINDDITNIHKIDIDFDFVFIWLLNLEFNLYNCDPEEESLNLAYQSDTIKSSLNGQKKIIPKIIYAGSSSKHHNPSKFPTYVYARVGRRGTWGITNSLISTLGCKILQCIRT